MATPQPFEPAVADAPPLRRMTRSSTNRVVAGVCAGVAEHLGVSVRTVRIVTIGLSVAAAGIPMYLMLWALAPQDTETQASDRPARPMVRVDRSQAGLLAGVVLLVIGLSSLGTFSWLGSGQDWLLPFAAILAGAAVAWSQLDEDDRPDGVPETPWRKALRVVRPGLGLVLVVAGVVAVAAQTGRIGDAVTVALSAVVVLVGAAVIAAPWVVRLLRRLQREEAERVRATERAEVAAHLHDSVLQTLALIQSTAEDPGRVQRLARSQERELRAWLYGAATPPGAATLASALRTVAEEIEDAHGIPVEVVTTGDRPLDEGLEALVAGLREALLNAVRHGAPPVTVYAEVGPTGVEAFVRDHGSGFDLDDVPADRLGVRESILGRMARHGGSARVRRLDDGTEVALALPLTAAADIPSEMTP